MNHWYCKGSEDYVKGIAFNGHEEMTDKQFRFWAYGWQKAYSIWLKDQEDELNSLLDNDGRM